MDYYTKDVSRHIVPPKLPGLPPLPPPTEIDLLLSDWMEGEYEPIRDDKISDQKTSIACHGLPIIFRPDAYEVTLEDIKNTIPNAKTRTRPSDNKEKSLWRPSSPLHHGPGRNEAFQIRSPPPWVMTPLSLPLHSADVDDSIRRASERQFRNHRTKGQKKRYVLPIMIGSGANTVVIMACPDSGSDENIISLEFANRLGLDIHGSGHEPRRFSLANGNIVEAIGQVTAQWCFGAEPPRDTPIMSCNFPVFKSLAVPVIIGMEVLERTETLSKHRDRLVEQLIPSMQALRVNSIGRPRRNLICRLDTYVGYASADTGSDLDLVSLEFARSRDLDIKPAREQLEFADCSIGYTSGVIKSSFSLVGKLSGMKGFLPHGNVVDLEFYVLEDLNADILVGQHTIDDLNVFALHTEAIIPSLPTPGESDVQIIRHIGTLERVASKIANKLEDKTLRHRRSKLMQIRELGSPTSFAAELCIEDQRENARREAVRAEIEKLTGLAKRNAEEDEVALIIKFEEERESLLKSQLKPATNAESAGSASNNDNHVSFASTHSDMPSEPLSHHNHPSMSPSSTPPLIMPHDDAHYPTRPPSPSAWSTTADSVKGVQALTTLGGNHVPEKEEPGFRSTT
ncbi:hypothetical protein NPX13_g8154 [Xylaria arbuscula]|uniref:Uncharacterized protein n=1 Tax=Xylaria arbuscula TaxID=114810 RepID=A0A9W8N975_9PEZI|nr:hypothetical protein NPX13_g8154 [Xylaria arbuscula]